MVTPFKTVEEYTFHLHEFIVHGRITVSVGLEKEFWEWETDFEDGSHPLRAQHDLQTTRANLFSYMNNFKSGQAKPVPY